MIRIVVVVVGFTEELAAGSSGKGCQGNADCGFR